MTPFFFVFHLWMCCANYERIGGWEALGPTCVEQCAPRRKGAPRNWRLRWAGPDINGLVHGVACAHESERLAWRNILGVPGFRGPLVTGRLDGMLSMLRLTG